MKIHPSFLLAALCVSPLHGQQSTLGAGDSYAWAANFGWIEMTPSRPNVGDGFRFGEASCSGYLWSATIGWIHCGDGAPANKISYANDGNTDYGVNHSGTGDLSGLAWCANTGWLNFGWATGDPENPNRPRVDLGTGNFSGYAWSANCGWINLGSGHLKTDTMAITDSDNDGISDAYEYAYTNSLGTMTAISNSDQDSVSDVLEYLALTNPFDSQSYLRVTAITPVNPNGTATSLTWISSPARRYVIERSTDLGLTNPWHPSPHDPQSFGADNGSVTTRTTLDVAAPTRFFRIKAEVPLQQP